jgi:hypothetical protein
MGIVEREGVYGKKESEDFARIVLRFAGLGKGAYKKKKVRISF